MICKHCNAEMDDNAKFCSNCGTPLHEPEQAPVEEIPVQETVNGPEIVEEKKNGTTKIVLAVVAVVLVIAMLAALVIGALGGKELITGDDATIAPTSGMLEETTEATTPADTGADDATCKGTYTADAEDVIAAADTVVAAMGDATLTVGQLQIFYWTEFVYFLQDYGTYASYFGLDYTQPLDTQTCAMTETPMTWQQYFLSCALETWASYQGMSLEAEANGLTIGQEWVDELNSLPDALAESAVTYGMESAEALLQANFGGAATIENYVNFWELYYTGYEYYDQQVSLLQPTADEVEAYFVENEELYAENGLTRDSKTVDVRHILVTIKGGTTDESGNTTYSDEEWETCRAEAQAILDQWLAGEATEDTFAALANEKSEDPGSNTVGGLYEGVYVGQMVVPFNDWCFDEARVEGDYGLVQTDYGYHVMYFTGSTSIWYSTVESDIYNERAAKVVPAVLEKYPYEVDYKAILLAPLDMG